MLWSDSVTLTDSNYFIHGPFNYDAHTDVIQTEQHIALTHWECLLFFSADLVLALLRYLF